MSDRIGLRALELRRVQLPLVSPFQTSFGSQSVRDAVLVRAITEHADGWGECVAMPWPLYSSESTDLVGAVIEHHLAPRLFAADLRTPADVAVALRPVIGHRMAKAALEAAILDAHLRATGQSLGSALGATASRIPCGVSVGIHPTVDDLLRAVERYVAQGYVRIKLKIQPGFDLDPVAAVRGAYGAELLLQVDANAAYDPATDIDHLRRLDEHQLLLVEQPFAEELLLAHADLRAAIDTPVCLDESIISAAVAAEAIRMGAVDIVNIKAGRVGGYLEAVRIHDLCVQQGVPVWCGGMVETGIGRAANAVLAALPGFTLPGDNSAFDRFFHDDIVTEPLRMVDGHLAVPTSPGMGFEVDMAALERVTTDQATLSA